MISKDLFAVYAQYNEDIIISSLLPNVSKGFYVDVGANHEKYHSVTKYFYDRGWSGINIEPIPRLLKEIAKIRKRDINLQLAVSTRQGKLAFREYPEYDGFSALKAGGSDEPAVKDLPHVDYSVKTDTLKNIFNKYKVTKIDFLKIDVEGHEFEVLKSNDWRKYKPTVICIEANKKSEDWAAYLETKGYHRVIFDGLNEYYIVQSMTPDFSQFAERVTLKAHSALRSHNLDMWESDIKRIKYLEKFADRQDKLIRSTQAALERTEAALEQTKAELAEKERLSLSGMAYRHRLKRAARGLTTDYVKSKRKK